MGKRAKHFGKEFKEFLTKGNVISLATGVIIGGAFQAIVNSLVNDIIMPIVGAFTKGIDFSKGFWDISCLLDPTKADYATAQLAQENGHVVVTYGTLLTAVINFLIIGFVIFLVVKGINSVDGAAKKIKRRGKPEAPAPEPEPTTKECPFCCSEISIKATRCPNCTSEQPVIEEEPEEEPEKEEANV